MYMVIFNSQALRSSASFSFDIRLLVPEVSRREYEFLFPDQNKVLLDISFEKCGFIAWSSGPLLLPPLRRGGCLLSRFRAQGTRGLSVGRGDAVRGLMKLPASLPAS